LIKCKLSITGSIGPNKCTVPCRCFANVEFLMPIFERKSWRTKTMARAINLTEVVFISSHVQIAGRNTMDKLADHSARGKMNTFSLSNIEIM
jgi:hypothetical protein